MFKMPPRRGESIERTDEREEFITKVAEYHEKRGYVFCVTLPAVAYSQYIAAQADAASQPIARTSIQNRKSVLDTSTC